MKKISIIVPAYREEPDVLKECIYSLIKQSYPSFKIILVLDSACSKEVKKTAKELSKLKKLKIVQDKKRGSASHRNLGVNLSWQYADYFAFTDADCVADENWLKELVKCIEKQPKNVGCVGGINISKEESSIGKAVQCAESSFMGGGGLSGQTTISKRIRYVNSIPNCNALYKKECWADNKQDENFIKGQDAEFNLRLSKNRWRFVQTPKAKVYHRRQSSLGEYAKRMFNYGKASANIIKKHGFYGFKRFWYSTGITGYYSLLLILIIASIFNNIFLPVMITFLIVYILIIAMAVLIETGRSRDSVCFLSFIIILMQHLSYTLGFLVAVFS